MQARAREAARWVGRVRAEWSADAAEIDLQNISAGEHIPGLSVHFDGAVAQPEAEMADGEPKDGNGGGEQLLVDDVANRFEGRPFPAKKPPSKTWPGKKGEQPQGDRSDALLRLLLRRASITGGGRDDDEDDEDDSDFL